MMFVSYRPFCHLLSFTLLGLLIAFSNPVKAQAPEGINYQAVARDNDGNPLDNRLISVRFGIFANSASGTLVHEEEHSTITTNDFGLFNLVIGQGIKIGGSTASFEVIDWSSDDYFLRVQIDAGNGFENLGTTQLLSVPYALYAKNAGIDPAFLVRFESDSAANADSLNALRNDLENINIIDFSPRIVADSIRLENLILKLQADSTALADSISALRSDIEVNRQKGTDNMRVISSLETRFINDSTAKSDSILSLGNGLTDLEDDIDDLEDGLDDLDSRFVSDSTAKSDSISDHRTDINANRQKGTDNMNEISNLDTRFVNDSTAKSDSINALRVDVDINTIDITDLDSRFVSDSTAKSDSISDHRSEIDANRQKGMDNMNDISNLDTRFVSDSTAKSDSISDHRSDIDANRQKGTDNMNDISNLDTRFVNDSTAKSDSINALRTDVDSIATGITDLDSRFIADSTAKSDSISDHRSEIDANRQKGTDNMNNISNLDTRFVNDSTAKADSINALRTDVDSIATGITDLDSRFIADSTAKSDSISDHRSDIDANRQKGTDNMNSITNLDTRFVADSANTANKLNLVDSTRIRNGTSDISIPTSGDSILFRINGTKKLLIDENGRSIFSDLVGIGTSAPPAYLSTFSNNDGIPSANFNTLGGDAPAEGLIITTNGVANDAFGIASNTFGGSNIIGFRSITNSISSSLSDSSVAIYARASGINNVYSGFFDRGNVFIRDTLILPTGANNGYVLTSDANGVASWQMPVVGGNVNTAGTNTVNRLAYWNDADSITFFDDLFVDPVTNRIGIGTTSPSQKLQVNGGIRVSGGFNANNGTSGTPSFRFETDANTGIFRAAADQLGFTTGGTEAMRIDDNGRLGIGLIVPDSLLDVAGGARVQALNINGAFSLPTTDGAANQVMQTDGAGALSWGTIPGDNFGNHIATTNIELDGNYLSGDGDNEGVFVDNSGNVGIGTASPTSPLTINTVIGDEIEFTGTVNANISATTQLNITTTSISLYQASEIRLRTNLTDRLTILNSGDVGIGTITPSGKLEVAGDGSLLGGLRVSGTTAATVGSSIYLDAATKDWTITATNTSSGAGNNKLVFRDYTSAADRMTIDDVGNVGIGTTNPNTRLQIHATSGAGNLRLTSFSTGTTITDGFTLSNDGGTEFLMWQHENANWGFITHTGTRAINISPNANVGIRTTTPSSELEVVGDIEIPAANDYTYSTAKTHYQSFAPTTFNSLLPDNYAYGTLSSATVYGYFRTGGTAFGYATVEVNLPDGAVVTEVRAWLWDNSATNPVRVRLIRQQLGLSTDLTMASVESATATATASVQNLFDNTIFSSTIDNANYSYYLRFTGLQNSTDTRLYGARITYTVTETD